MLIICNYSEPEKLLEELLLTLENDKENRVHFCRFQEGGLPSQRQFHSFQNDAGKLQDVIVLDKNCLIDLATVQECKNLSSDIDAFAFKVVLQRKFTDFSHIAYTWKNKFRYLNGLDIKRKSCFFLRYQKLSETLRSAKKLRKLDLKVYQQLT